MALELSLLPEAHPEDVEDVVWGLQTAAALWHRGEQRQAVVWIRRAAEAAGSAGQDMRAVQLAKSAVDLEQLFGPADGVPKPQADAPPPRSVSPPRPPLPSSILDEETSNADDLLEEETHDLEASKAPEVAARPQGPEGSRPAAPIAPPSDATLRSAPSLPSASGVPSASRGSSSGASTSSMRAVPPPPSSTAAPFSTAAPLSTGAPSAPRPRAMSSQAIPAAVGPARSQPTTPAPAPVAPPPSALSQTQPMPIASPALLASATAPPADLAPPPHSPPIEPSPASSAEPQPAPAPAVVAAPPSVARPAEPMLKAYETEKLDSSSLARLGDSGTHPVASQMKKRMRAPILDPWSDEMPESEAPPRTAHLRHDAAAASDDDDVVTSAPPLDTSLRRKPPPPPPPAKRLATLSGTTLEAVTDASLRIDASPVAAPVAQAAPAGPAEASATKAPPPPPPAARKPTLVPRAGGAPVSVAMPQASAVPTESGEGPRERKSIPPPPPVRAPSSAEGPVSSRPSAPPPAPSVVTPSPAQVEVIGASPAKPADGADVRSEPPPPTMPAAKVDARPASSPPPAPAPPAAPAVAAAPAPHAPSPPAPPPEELEARAPSRPPVVLFGDSAEPPQPSPTAAARAPSPPRPASTPPRAPSTPPRPASTRPSSAPAAPPAPVQAGPPVEKIDAFADLPDELHQALRLSAKLATLGLEEEVSVTGAAVVLEGTAAVCAAIADCVAAQANIASLVPAFSSLDDSTKIRLVATEAAVVASWDRAALQEALRSCPWVLDDLTTLGDRYAALAGATMGPLGDLDEYSRLAALERLSVRVLKANEVLAAAGAELAGLMIVGSGVIIVERSSPIEYSSGDIVLPDTVLDGGITDAPIKAGEGGALVLHATRTVTVELFSILPSLLELLRVA
jgi:hypothetical protein